MSLKFTVLFFKKSAGEVNGAFPVSALTILFLIRRLRWLSGPSRPLAGKLSFPRKTITNNNVSVAAVVSKLLGCGAAGRLRLALAAGVHG
jgi:hypothetical protein